MSTEGTKWDKGLDQGCNLPLHQEVLGGPSTCRMEEERRRTMNKTGIDAMMAMATNGISWGDMRKSAAVRDGLAGSKSWKLSGLVS